MTEQVIRSWTDAFMAEDWDKISEIYAEVTAPACFVSPPL